MQAPGMGRRDGVHLSALPQGTVDTGQIQGIRGVALIPFIRLYQPMLAVT